MSKNVYFFKHPAGLHYSAVHVDVINEVHERLLNTPYL